MARIAVIGPGAIGCTMTAWLAQSRTHDLVVAARTAFDYIQVDSPQGPIACRPRVLKSVVAATPVDWVLVATKAYDAAAAATWLRGFVEAKTRVAILQNGVEHIDRFSACVRPDALVPVVVDCPVERLGPGRVRQRGPARMIVPEGANGRGFVELFAGTPVQVQTTDDWRSAAWRKLCLNAAGAVSALTLIPARIAHDAKVAAVMAGIVREAVQVGRAEGAVLDDGIVDAVLAASRNAPGDSINSLQADRLARRPMEADARNGVIVRLGRKHGIATPYNETVFALLNALQPQA